MIREPLTLYPTPAKEILAMRLSVVGATGKQENHLSLQPLKFKLGKQWVTHQFLYMPDCPVPLMGRDLLSKSRMLSSAYL